MNLKKYYELFPHFSLDFNAFIEISLRKTTMFWNAENHFLFVGLFAWRNTTTKTFLVSRNRGGFALAESWTRKSGTVATLHNTVLVFSLRMDRFQKYEYQEAANEKMFQFRD